MQCVRHARSLERLHGRRTAAGLPGHARDRTRTGPLSALGPHQDNVAMDAAEWDERYRATELVWSAGPNQFVEAELADLPAGRAVDLAAGEGRNAIWLARRGWEVTAVDFSQAGLDKGRVVAGETPVRWVCADATTWSADSSYDLCVIAYLQLRAAERRAAVRNGYAALRVGGTFFLVAHDTTNLTEGTGGPTSAAVLMTAEDVLTDLGGETFEVQHAGRVAREVGGPEHKHANEPAATAWDCLVRVVRRA
jgi:SAM-dependent methyltransferase